MVLRMIRVVIAPLRTSGIKEGCRASMESYETKTSPSKLEGSGRVGRQEACRLMAGYQDLPVSPTLGCPSRS